MRRLLVVILVLSILLISNCAPSVGRKTIEKDKVEIELSLGGSFFYYTPIPLPLPNLGIGLRYGVDNNVNVGVRLFPLLLTFSTAQATPYTVVSVFKSSDEVIPSFNAYGEVDLVMYFDRFETVFFPLVGVCSVWELSLLSIYLPLEVVFDVYSQRIPVKFNLGLGTEFKVVDNLNISLELRLNSIGNIYLPLGSMIGIPVFYILASYKF